VERRIDPTITLKQFQFIGIFTLNSNHLKRAKKLISQLFRCSLYTYIT
jgi:hypothetical protein